MSSHRRIDPVPQLLARLEMRHMPCGHGNRRAGLRITPDTGRTGMQPEAAESPDFDPLA